MKYNPNNPSQLKKRKKRIRQQKIAYRKFIEEIEATPQPKRRLFTLPSLPSISKPFNTTRVFIQSIITTLIVCAYWFIETTFSFIFSMTSFILSPILDPLMCFFCIIRYSLTGVEMNPTAKRSLNQFEMQERLFNLEEEVVQIHEYYQSLIANFMRQQKALQETQQYNYHLANRTGKLENIVNSQVIPTCKKINKMGSMNFASVQNVVVKNSPAPISLLAPPPPPPPPPSFAAPKKLDIKKNEDKVAKNVPAKADKQLVFTLDTLLTQRNLLKKRSEPMIDENINQINAQRKAPGAGNQTPISLKEINSLQLRKRELNSPSKSSPKSPKQGSLFSLKKTQVQRSPGGTPLRTGNNLCSSSSTTNIISCALRSKFKNARNSRDDVTLASSPDKLPFQDKYSSPLACESVKEEEAVYHLFTAFPMSSKYFSRSISNGKMTFFHQEERDEIELLSPRNIVISKEEEGIRLSRETSLSALFTPRWRKRDNCRPSDEEKLPRKNSNPSRPDIPFSLELEISCDTDIPLPNFPENVNISNLSPPISEKHLQWLSLSCKGTPPSPRIHHTACVVGDNMFIFGGTDGDSLKNQLFLLDLHTYTWLHPLTTGKNQHIDMATLVQPLMNYYISLGVKQKQLFLMTSFFLTQFYVTDVELHHKIENLKWYKVANKGTVPPAVAYHTAHYYNRKIYIFGGTKIDGSTNDYIYIYDIEKHNWVKNGLKVKGRSMASSMLLSQKHLVMIVGGYRSKNGKFCKSQIKHSLIVDLQTSTVINSPIKTPKLSNHTCFIHEDSLLLFGGRDRELNLSSELHYFDHNQWRKLDNIQGEQICPTYGQSVVVLQNKILFFGGITTNNVFVKDTYMLQVGAMKSIQSNDIIFELLSQPNADVLHRRSKIKYIENNELTLIGRIANGATCIVNLAQWKNKNVVVKQYYNYDREIFLKEIKILCGLRHKNIVKFLGCVMNDEKMCVILKYHHFGDLFNYLKKQITRLEWPLILHMALDVAKGMNYLHQNNILHRDLKSSNLLVASTSYRDKVTIKLMDFGDSKEISHTKEEAACGTARWTAPEVFRKEPYSPKSDVYSFGIILWELVNLRTPCDQLKRDYEVEDYVVNGGRPIMHITPTLCYKQLMEACWDQSPDNRPTFDEIILILEDVCRKLLPVYDNNDLSDRTVSDHEDFSDK